MPKMEIMEAGEELEHEKWGLAEGAREREGLSFPNGG